MKPTIADIFRDGFESFLTAGPRQPAAHYQVVRAITTCRTPALGGHTERCDSCGTKSPRYHSCRNRHCPRCQSTARISWVNERLNESLPVGYFHVVFTVPSELNPFALRNKKVFYDIMFRAVKETIHELSANQRFLGADTGFIAVLHTWGQTLVDHPHIHCIIPAGGYDTSLKRWKGVKNDFLFPVTVVRKLFRGKVMAFFTDAIRKGTIVFNGNLEQWSELPLLRGLIDRLYRTDWVVYIKEPFASNKALLAYLGAYTHRVGISDSRIERFENGMVSFKYKDYADNGCVKTMQLTASEFIRRFLLHVLPRGFKRIRYFGFMASRARGKRLKRCRDFFKLPERNKEKTRKVLPWYETVKELTGRDPLRCLACGLGRMRTVGWLPRIPLYPPAVLTGS